MLLKWRQRGEKNGEGGGVKCRFFSSTAQARSNRMGQKDTAGVEIMTLNATRNFEGAA